MRSALMMSLALTGCYYSHAVPIGRPEAPLAPGCAVRQEQIDPEEAGARLRQTGVLCHTNYTGRNRVRLDDFDSLDRADFEQHVCELGGQVVVVAGLCNVGKAHGVEWRIYRAR